MKSRTPTANAQLDLSALRAPASSRVPRGATMLLRRRARGCATSLGMFGLHAALAIVAPLRYANHRARANALVPADRRSGPAHSARTCFARRAPALPNSEEVMAALAKERYVPIRSNELTSQ
jgi:hypothetical protein